MKTSRVPRAMPQKNSDSESNTPRLGHRRPVWPLLPGRHTVFSELSAEESSVLKVSPYNTPRPTVSRTDNGAAIQAEADKFRKSAQKMQNESRAKLKSLPFNLAYIPPANNQLSFTAVYETGLTRPATARSEVSRNPVNTVNYKNFIGPAIRTMEKDKIPARIRETSSGIGDGGLSSRRSKNKAPGTSEKPGTAPAQVTELKIDKSSVVLLNRGLSLSDCSIETPKSSRSSDKELQLNVAGAKRLPDWLIALAERDTQVHKMNKKSSSPRIATVKHKSPMERIPLTSRRETQVPTAVIEKHSSASFSLSTDNTTKSAGFKKKKLPSTHKTSVRESSSVLATNSSSSLRRKKPLLPKKSSSAEAMQSAIRAKSRTEVKQKTLRQTLQTKSADEKQFAKSSYSRNIRSAVNTIKELSSKRILETAQPKSGTSLGIGNVKEKEGAAGGKSKVKKIVLRSKPKKPTPSKFVAAMTKAQTLRNKFLGSQYQIVDHQLRNLSERQRALEKEVLVFFDSLQKTFCEESCCSHCSSSHGPKCCCNDETQEKMKSLLQKQKEVIQLQIDMRKRYGIDHYNNGPVSEVEPILNGFNAHFGELISHIREIDGKMVYYCAVCNVACDDELSFRRHLENTKHVVKTCKGIQNTQPLYTCDDCETKCRGATKYMSHVINNNFHKDEQS